MENEPIHGELIHLVGEFMALRFPIPEIEGDVGDLHAFIALDRSGSMSGQPILDAKGALISLIQKFRRADIPVTIYLFSNILQEASSEDIGYDPLLEHAENLKAGGGTRFAPVIQRMYQRINERGYENLFCVWLSDGQDNQGLEKLIPSMNKFKGYMYDKNVSIAIHTIGFSNDHDANLLTELSQSGTRGGTFQFVPPKGRIPVAVNNIFELAFESMTWGNFVSESNSYKIDIESDEGYERGMVYISEDDLGDCKIELHKGQELQIFPVEPVRGDDLEFKERVFMVTQFVSTKIIGVIERGAEVKELIAIRGLIEMMESRVKALERENLNNKPFYRKQCEPYFTTTLELIENYYTTLKEVAGSQLSNLQLANLNNLAHKNALKKNLERKIAKEMGNNIQMINEQESQISRVLQELDKESLEREYGEEADSLGECILTARNWLEAFLEGDCLCLTLQIERPQDLLGDALEIKIVKVNSTLITCDGFVDSALFETKAGQMIQAERNYQHGQAPLPASSLVNGLPNEIINAILPIYINEEHWKIASLRIRPMIAWDLTVDVLGFIPSQLLTFPFMVMIKSLEMANTEFEFIEFQLIKDTCLAVYRENREHMLSKLSRIVDWYFKEPSSRLPEQIPSNGVMLAWLYCAWAHGDITKVEHLFPYIFEEEFRRRSAKKKQIEVHKLAKQLLNIDLTEEKRKLKEKIALKEEYKPPIFSGTIEELPHKTAEFFQNIDLSVTTQGKMMYSCAKLISLFDTTHYSGLDSIGLITNEQKLAFVFQTFRDRANFKRKEAFETGLFINSFDPESALHYVEEIYTDVLKREMLSERAFAIKEMKELSDNEKLYTFKNTDDPEEAAGCLLGTLQGSTTFATFYKVLMDPTTPIPVFKLKLLNRGHLNEVKIILDNMQNGKPCTWVPNNKKFHKIWTAHASSVNEEEWIDAVPEKAEYIRRKYLRLQGEFVKYTKPRKNVRDRRHFK